MSNVDCFDCSASLLTSEATTLKPLPISPALAASIEAFSARRLVCSAIPEITEVICVISSDFCLRIFISFETSLLFSVTTADSTPSSLTILTPRFTTSVVELVAVVISLQASTESLIFFCIVSAFTD